MKLGSKKYVCLQQVLKVRPEISAGEIGRILNDGSFYEVFGL